ncbi:sensor histidine kinase [Bacillus luteolus]|uniref:Sensor histidine kinase n=1 Tax=Litchfieldia luteola TaxID=682179 RepID=A0ABR9QQ40_9BACI|nr:sensor histidine kinase [Cytobacillus luteolus]MBE4910631.1 sensor histidine kinase [Cytobacillus luteolus]MBP1943810.1 NarL family two-component system sensor histidine kinase LiaS [Cytobacillus luteolus]
MSLIQKQLVISVFISIILLVTTSGVFLTAFPLTDWGDLWNRKVMDVPFVIFAPSISILIGLMFGFITGMLWRNQLRSISNKLVEVEQGKQIEIDELHQDEELDQIFNQVKKINRQMLEQVKSSQKLANVKAEEQEKRIQEIVSQERNRLARELHDSVSQQLFAASMVMSAITETKTDPDSAETKRLKMVEEMIHQSQLEMRALLLHLRPVALKGKSLQEGMKELLTELSQKVTMGITWKIEDTQLDKGVEDHLFRILQESVSNTLRHAKASNLEVILIMRDGMAILRVVDDGKGFDVEQSKSGSYGMQNMYERALEIGGTLKVVSVKDKGTRLEVKVPMIRIEGEGH